MQMLNTVVQKLDRLNELLPQVRELAQRHVEYGVKDSDYDTVSSALMWTLGIGLISFRHRWHRRQIHR
jgi:hemoglobin-like flavoprotein